MSIISRRSDPKGERKTWPTVSCCPRCAQIKTQGTPHECGVFAPVRKAIAERIAALSSPLAADVGAASDRIDELRRLAAQLAQL